MAESVTKGVERARTKEDFYEDISRTLEKGTVELIRYANAKSDKPEGERPLPENPVYQSKPNTPDGIAERLEYWQQLEKLLVLNAEATKREQSARLAVTSEELRYKNHLVEKLVEENEDMKRVLRENSDMDYGPEGSD